MTNYDDWTDRQINDKVRFFLEREGKVVWMLDDYCNNPGDMWPIIAENEIDIIWQSPPMAFKVFGMGDSDPIDYSDHNCLRAAAIVYLKMMEAKS